MASVPTVDLSDPTAGAALVAALEGSSSALLVGHGIDQQLRRAMVETSRAFFARPAEAKGEVRWPGTGAWHGWQPVYEGAEELTGDRAPDLVERFEVQDLDTYSLWPDEPVGFAGTWTAYYEACAALASRVVALMVEELDLPREELPAWTDGHYANLVANHYLPQPDPPAPGQTRVGPHTDRGGLTLLAADEAPGGLEVRLAERTWTPLVIPPEAYVVQVGDLFSRWTNRRIPANVHRVVNPPRDVAATASRLAVVYFHYPALDHVVAPAPSCVGEGGTRVEPIVSGEHLLNRQAAFRYGADEPYAVT